MKYNSKKFNIRYTANFTSKYKNNNIRAWFARPIDSEYQKIEKINISLEPHSNYNDKQGNKIMYFNFKNRKNIKVQMDIKITLQKSKINLVKEKIVSSLSSSKLFKQYTKNEKFLEQTKQLKEIVKDITKNKKTDLEKIQVIFEFVMKNFKYCYPIKKRGVKYLNLKSLKGDCGEYSSLFVTMCRILCIPARNNTGFVIFPKQKSIKEHGWVSIYLKPYGWINFDPQYASLEKDKKNSFKKYFGQRSDYRISFINGFNIPLKPKIPLGFDLSYWKKVYLPISNNSTQILQPIVFASKEKVKFKEKIEILN